MPAPLAHLVLQLAEGSPAMLLTTLLAFVPVLSTTAPLNNAAAGIAQEGKHPRLSAEEAAEARAKVRKTFGELYVAAESKPDKKKELLQKLLEVLAILENSPVERFGVLLECQEVAVECNDLQSALRAIDLLGAGYEGVDNREMAIDAFVAVAPNLRREAAAEACQLGETLLFDLIELEDAERARRLSSALVDAAKRAADSDLRKKMADLAADVSALEELKAALKKLADEPRDPAANRAAGMYYTFRMEDLTRGLPHLALAPEDELTQCARLDCAGPTMPEAQVAVGDAWLAWSRGSGGRPKAIAQLRAIYWFERALPGMSELERFPYAEKVKSTQEELAKSSEARPIRTRVVSSRPTARKLQSDDRRAVERAVGWLVRHQNDDGRWSCEKFSLNCASSDDVCSGPGSEIHDVGTTGLATLALLTWGTPTGSTRADQSLSRAIEWLVEQQEDDGQIGTREGHGFIYDHAIATLALLESLSVSPSSELRKTCEQAVEFIIKARNPYSAWRYEVPPNGESDTSVTAWMIEALAKARKVGITVPEGAFSGGMAWINEVTDKATARVGYDTIGSLSSRIQRVNDHYPAEKGEAMTAAGLLCRFLVGEDPKSSAIMTRNAERLASNTPVWDPDSRGIDLYYWYYGTEAMHRMAGIRPAQSNFWNKCVRKALLESQRVKGDMEGSWDPVGVWDYAGGRVCSTSFAILTLTRPGR